MRTPSSTARTMGNSFFTQYTLPEFQEACKTAARLGSVKTVSWMRKEGLL